MTINLRLTLAQCNPTVGDVQGNLSLLFKVVESARRAGSDIVVFPELFLVGYPPEDLLFRRNMPSACEQAIEAVREASQSWEGLTVVFGAPCYKEGECYNAAYAIQSGRVAARYFKKLLPNFAVFDEKRYFIEGKEKASVTVKGVKFGLSICEDIWRCDSIYDIVEQDVQSILSLNASPFYYGKQADRVDAVMRRATEAKVPFVYCNLVGGQDELVFDGGSMVACPVKGVVHDLPHFEPITSTIQMSLPLPESEEGASASTQWTFADTRGFKRMNHEQECYAALVVGTRDYVQKNGFSRVLLGLSGGIDSALTLAVAVDALGAQNVTAVMMPFHYTADISKQDAAEQAQRMGVNYLTLPIESAYNAFMGILEEPFEGTQPGLAEQNIQARCRGLLLMAMSNKLGGLLLSTSNKSEVAVGYSTLYGDMAGAYTVPKDVYKTDVYRLARYRNELTPDNPPIPDRVITRAPSAELAPDQQDSDSLPEYDVLDGILHLHIEANYHADAIVAQGFKREDVERVLSLVKRNEYKRFQAAPGPRITRRGFGKDWRIPLTNGLEI